MQKTLKQCQIKHTLPKKFLTNLKQNLATINQEKNNLPKSPWERIVESLIKHTLPTKISKPAIKGKKRGKLKKKNRLEKLKLVGVK